MASSIMAFQSFCFMLPSYPVLRRHRISISSTSLCPCSNSLQASFSPPKTNYYHFNHLYRVNSEGTTSESIEDPKFVPLNADDPVYGPPALLLLGFETEETIKVIHCTEDMIDCSLWEAMHAQQPDLEVVKIAKSLPRICFLSGLTGEEMMMFIDAFPETGLKPAVFAALVPNSANKPLGEVMEEIMGDHEMMSAKQPGPP
ncbi:uncharacterized protein LOC131231316 isoform X2 [Magnolia sinica]|uniref:uncharacterized protein LOC131231316 isoform X2 n=1 Tax=Magnolia sinica TaxID=86752 RepID=UPI00265810FD|nr:uncharacterized protein LOC131231316 isoform X2 [Magnolia sinica]